MLLFSIFPFSFSLRRIKLPQICKGWMGGEVDRVGMLRGCVGVLVSTVEWVRSQKLFYKGRKDPPIQTLDALLKHPQPSGTQEKRKKGKKVFPQVPLTRLQREQPSAFGVDNPFNTFVTLVATFRKTKFEVVFCK